MAFAAIAHWFKAQRSSRSKTRKSHQRNRRSFCPHLEHLESRTLLTGVTMNFSGAVGFKSFTDVGFRENTVAHLYASINGKPDTKVTDFKAQIDWGDAKDPSKGDLVYIGSTGTRAEFLVKGSHAYESTSTGWANTITVTGPSGSKVTGKGARISAAMMPSGLPGTMPSLPSGVTAPAKVQLQLGEVFTISSFIGVGFQRNAVANLYVSLNGKPDTNLSHVHAQINWGDSSSWTEAELVYTGTSGSNAQYLVKGSHIYSTQSSGMPLVVYATGTDGTSFSSAEPRSSVANPQRHSWRTAAKFDHGIAPAYVQLQLGEAGRISTTVGADLQNVPVANLYVSVNGKPDTSINNIHAQINWGDSAAWTSATLAYIGSSGNLAQYQIKGSHQYMSASTRMPILVYATGKDGTSFSARGLYCSRARHVCRARGSRFRRTNAKPIRRSANSHFRRKPALQQLASHRAA